MILLRKPSDAQIRRFLDDQRSLPFSCPEVGASRDEVPPGYPVNQLRGRLGVGPETFALAVEALRRWKMYELRWTKLCRPEAPIAEGTVVGVLGRHFGVWSLNACRIVYVIEEGPSLRRYGFSAYGASKHGIDGFLEALRVELKHEGWPISVTQVMPGTINTPFFDKGRTKLGVKPVGIPPIYEPETVANIILYAAENPARDLVSGGAAQALILNQRLSPRMLDAVLTTRAGFAPQKTDELRSEDNPDNLYTPIRGHDTAKNGFRALSRSLYNWLEMHPVVRRGAAAGTALGLMAALRRRS